MAISTVFKTLTRHFSSKTLLLDVGVSTSRAAIASNGKVLNMLEVRSSISVDVGGVYRVGKSGFKCGDKLLVGGKFLLGSKYLNDEISELKRYRMFKLGEGEDGTPSFWVNGGLVSAIEFIAMIIDDVKKKIESTQKVSLKNVLFCSIEHDISARSELKKAGELVGLEVSVIDPNEKLGLISSSYALVNIDGCLEVSLVFNKELLSYEKTVNGGTFKLKSLLVEVVIEKVKSQYGIDFSNSEDFLNQIWVVLEDNMDAIFRCEEVDHELVIYTGEEKHEDKVYSLFSHPNLLTEPGSNPDNVESVAKIYDTKFPSFLKWVGGLPSFKLGKVLKVRGTRTIKVQIHQEDIKKVFKTLEVDLESVLKSVTNVKVDDVFLSGCLADVHFVRRCVINVLKNTPTMIRSSDLMMAFGECTSITHIIPDDFLFSPSLGGIFPEKWAYLQMFKEEKLKWNEGKKEIEKICFQLERVLMNEKVEELDELKFMIQDVRSSLEGIESKIAEIIKRIASLEKIKGARTARTAVEDKEE